MEREREKERNIVLLNALDSFLKFEHDRVNLCMRNTLISLSQETLR